MRYFRLGKVTRVWSYYCLLALRHFLYVLIYIDYWLLSIILYYSPFYHLELSTISVLASQSVCVNWKCLLFLILLHGLFLPPFLPLTGSVFSPPDRKCLFSLWPEVHVLRTLFSLILRKHQTFWSSETSMPQNILIIVSVTATLIGSSPAQLTL